MTDVSSRSPSPPELLLAWEGGEAKVFEQLVPLVHDELHRLARSYMGQERPGDTCRQRRLSTRRTPWWRSGFLEG